MKLRSLFLVTWIFLSLAGCSTFQYKEPKVELSNIYVKDLSFSGATLMLVLDVDNPNNKDIDVKELQYKVMLGGQEFTAARTEKPVHVPALKKAQVDIPLPFQYSRIFENIADVLGGKEIAYRIEGRAKLSFTSVPFLKEGKLKLQ